ncbi:hypothetical protein KI688_007544 [Linnemannia hyalina]|uniref:F-box domain-containing protein n=1 Tax=Linnemannia hyalina TaxID=64524 RepID=A0A9P7XHG5_9FUNG|nr:hypothetical protein KI688_007544 [Linnemannia hyalina]
MNPESITIDATSFSDLPPEVHGMVASQLDSYDLSLCVLVSKTWRASFHRYLWRHVAIMMDESDDFDPKLLKLLKANREHVHSLTLFAGYGDVLHSFLELIPLSSNPRLVFPNLYSAEISCEFGESTDQTMAQFLELTGTKWKRLVFNDTSESRYGIDFGPQSIKVLARHAEFLKVFHWSSETGSSDGLVEQLLRSASKLRELSVVGQYRSSGGWLDARKIVEIEWVCLDLEVFQCRIRNIPRPDITRDIGDDPTVVYIEEGTLQESLDLQRQVYTKLAKLTKLRELKLGLVIEVCAPEYQLGDKTCEKQFDCLAMTLDSGLDLLKGLKELRVVGLEDMEIYVEGEREQAWFKEHWPNAKIELGEYFHDQYLE